MTQLTDPSTPPPSTPTVVPLHYDGERMVPEAADQWTFVEHVARYRFAMRYVTGRDVLDIACGEGYGSAAIVTRARSVIGIDIDPVAVEHARLKYHIDARVGSAEAIPVPDRSVDVVVSFETLEHVPSPSQFLDECARVLRPGGKLIVSTPNKPVYNQHTPANPFHQSEVDLEQFAALLAKRFVVSRTYGQYPLQVPTWSAAALANENSFWRKTRFVGRLFKWASAASGFEPLAADKERAAIVDCIAAGETRAGLFDPYTPRPLPVWSLAGCKYLIAVATPR